MMMPHPRHSANSFHKVRKSENSFNFVLKYLENQAYHREYNTTLLKRPKYIHIGLEEYCNLIKNMYVASFSHKTKVWHYQAGDRPTSPKAILLYVYYYMGCIIILHTLQHL